MRRLAAISLLFISGCWNIDPAELPANVVDFEPELPSDLDWQVTSYELGLTCPDGEQARYYFVGPKTIPEDPMPAAVIYHSGSFDYVFSPSREEPLAGAHYQTVESRLTQSWAIRRVFVMLGMFPEDDPYEYHVGSLPLTLAEFGVPSLIPVNCWGDLWHNRAAIAENSFTDDRFFRNGRVSAEWGYRALADVEFATEQGIDIPVLVDPERIYAFGLGEGGRAVNELLAADSNGDGILDHSPAGVLVDSSPDDLRAYYTDPLLYSNIISGLNRIFPGGSDATVSTSLGFVPQLPPRVAYIYSANDSRLPATIHDAAVARLNGAGMYTRDVAVPRHILTNADDLTLTREAVAYVLNVDLSGGDTGAALP